ncbi:potassium/proton antiporter [Halieaceae bacterium IMCC14734]|uniref:Potassium/proton antiporter n=1 Tax=Candidatus Litorirhabdus singularis TaxID=2518993 RepID=A0ABT3TM74_9GAMM|nr:potassium/proton antiporter [Candidatus Litorirhabdus singularis]MCX2983428.1 potassium/proton antiporter [Candidatus Litorirhabdus singularis]
MDVSNAILVCGTLLIISTLSSKLSDRFGVPVLLLFLLIGMLAGSEGIGGIAFNSPEQAQSIGTVALCIILFAGGLDTRWASVKSVLAPGLMLSTLGVFITMLSLGVFAKFVLGGYTSFYLGTDGLSWTEAFLIAAIVSSTDAAAVFSVYRTSPVQPKKNLRSLLEFESGSNDPMAILLTLTLLGIISNGDQISVSLAGTLIEQLSIGGIAGGLIGWVGVTVLNRLSLSTAGLYPTMVLGLGLLSFGAAEWLAGNGYLSVYVAGLVIGNKFTKGRAEIMSFHDGLSWLMQIIIFVMLGLLVFPSQLIEVAGVSVVLALFLMFVGRPLAVFLCYLPFRPKKQELLYVSWVGMRGSVPIVLATFPATYGLAGASQIFHLVFFFVLVSVLVQGLTLVPAARYFNVTED